MMAVIVSQTGWAYKSQKFARIARFLSVGLRERDSKFRSCEVLKSIKVLVCSTASAEKLLRGSVPDTARLLARVHCE